jgi:DNA-binding NarL/FixJ family response regulator
MRSIKVLLANDPTILREVVRAIIARQPDMEVVGEILDPLGVLLAAKATQADVVVLDLRGAEEPGLVSHLLAECPQVTILGLASHGDTALMVQRRLWRKEIVDPSEVNILRALRHAVREPGSAWYERSSS